MSEEWILESTASGTSRTVAAALLVSVIAIAAAGSYVAAQTMMGRGSLGVIVTAPPTYGIQIAFYRDNAASQLISSVNIPQGDGLSTIVYAKIRNVSGSNLNNLYIGGGGHKLWMNVWRLDGTDLYSGGQMRGYFNLNNQQEMIVKVQVGLTGQAVQGDNLTLNLEVFQ